VNLCSSIESGLDGIETGALPMSRDEHGGNLSTGPAVAGVKGRDSHSGFRTELENLSGDGKRKAQAAPTVRLKLRCVGQGRTAP
jgi:hypothetical protein